MPSPVFLEGETVTLHPVEDSDTEFLVILPAVSL